MHVSGKTGGQGSLASEVSHTVHFDPGLLKTTAHPSPRSFQGAFTSSSRGNLGPVHSSWCVYQLLEISGVMVTYLLQAKKWGRWLFVVGTAPENWGWTAQLCSDDVWKALSVLGSSYDSRAVDMFVLIPREGLRCVGGPCFILIIKSLIRFTSHGRKKSLSFHNLGSSSLCTISSS